MPAPVEDDGEYALKIDGLLQTVERQQNEIKLRFNQAVKRLNKNFVDIDACLAKRTHLKKDYQDCEALLTEAKDLDALNTSQALSYEKRLEALQKNTNFLGETKRKAGSTFLRYILGDVSVRVWNESDRKQLKSEHYKFKQFVTLWLAIFPLVQLIFGFSWVLYQSHHVLSIYFSISLAIRENVLKINGSRINSWWFTKHYLGIGTSWLSLLLLRSAYDSYEGYFTLNTFFSFWSAVVIWVMTQNQKAQHYARMAIRRESISPKATSKTMVGGPSWTSTWYFILIPLLYVTYVLEFLLAGYCIFKSLENWYQQMQLRIFELECLMLGILWLLVAFGNIITTSRTIHLKHRKMDINSRTSQMKNRSKKFM